MYGLISWPKQISQDIFNIEKYVYCLYSQFGWWLIFISLNPKLTLCGVNADMKDTSIFSVLSIIQKGTVNNYSLFNRPNWHFNVFKDKSATY